MWPSVLHIGQVSDRKSTRLNSSHLVTSYAVFCLKKKRMIATNATLLARDQYYQLLARIPDRGPGQIRKTNAYQNVNETFPISDTVYFFLITQDHDGNILFLRIPPKAS